MFFSASARLAEATSDLGNLAERFDEYLKDANDSWLMQAVNVANGIGERRDKVEYLLEQAASGEVGLLVAETHIQCRNNDNLISLAEITRANAADEEVYCTQCGEPFEGDEQEVTAYRLSPEAVAEADDRRQRPRRRLVILTALELELRAVLSHLTNVRRENHPKGTVYQFGSFETDHALWEVATVSIGAGNAGAASEVERAIAHFEPEAALFVGIAGGIKDVELGDVVAADQVFLYHSGKAGNQFTANPEVYRPTSPLLSGARAAAIEERWQARIVGVAGGDPKAVIAPVAAGEQVVASEQSDTYALIREHYQRAVAVEMEGGGFLRGAYGNQQVGALVVRGISDQLANKKSADAAGWQTKAARHAAAFAFEVIATLP